jgi:MFS family permease
MKIMALLLSVIPLPYLFSQSPAAIWVFNFYSGICWSGYGISNFSYLMEASGEENPERQIAVVMAFNGITVFLFGLAGGFLATRLPALFGWQLRSLFLLSAVLRLTVVATLFRFLRPLSVPPPGPTREIYDSIPGYRVGMGVMRVLYRAFRRH